jgi:hypothetical protein
MDAQNEQVLFNIILVTLNCEACSEVINIDDNGFHCRRHAHYQDLPLLYRHP